MADDYDADVTEDKMRIPRFRIVLDASFPGAHPFDPSHYDELFSKLQRLLETNTEVECRDISIREICTVGDVGDFSTWRFDEPRGSGRPGIRFSDPGKTGEN